MLDLVLGSVRVSYGCYDKLPQRAQNNTDLLSQSAGRGPWVKVRVLVGLCSLGGSQRDPVPDLASLAGHSSSLACSFCSPLHPLLSMPQFHSPPSLPLPSIRTLMIPLGFPGGSDSKESGCKAGDAGSIPGWERSPGEGRSAYLRLLIFLLAILIPACASSSPAFLMIFSAYISLNKQGDNIHP